MSSFIRLRKTSPKKRVTYKCLDEQGQVVCEIKPGQDGITEVDIRNCHKVDDMEAYENQRSFNPKFPDWLQPSVSRWEQRHKEEFIKKAGRNPLPGEVTRYNFLISLDACVDEDGNEADSVKVMDEIIRRQEAPSPEIGYLREIVESMPAHWQEIYQAVLIEGQSLAAVAKKRGVTEGAVRKTVGKIKRLLAQNEKLQSLFHGMPDDAI